jgi:hypothetical protein
VPFGKASSKNKKLLRASPRLARRTKERYSAAAQKAGAIPIASDAGKMLVAAPSSETPQKPEEEPAEPGGLEILPRFDYSFSGEGRLFWVFGAKPGRLLGIIKEVLLLIVTMVTKVPVRGAA